MNDKEKNLIFCAMMLYMQAGDFKEMNENFISACEEIEKDLQGEQLADCILQNIIDKYKTKK